MRSFRELRDRLMARPDATEKAEAARRRLACPCANDACGLCHRDGNPYPCSTECNDHDPRGVVWQQWPPNEALRWRTDV